MDKIQLMTQPEKQSNSKSPEERTLQKLKDLVADSQHGSNEDDENTAKENNNDNGENVGPLGSKNQDLNDQRHQHTKKENGEPCETQDKQESKGDKDVEYDHDGFVIPPGKIPLDGNFSTSELTELVKLSKKEGLLKDDVKLKVLESNESIGDKVVLSESRSKNDGDIDSDAMGSGNEKSKNDGESKDSDDKENDSVDPKEKAKQYGGRSKSG